MKTLWLLLFLLLSQTALYAEQFSISSLRASEKRMALTEFKKVYQQRQHYQHHLQQKVKHRRSKNISTHSIFKPMPNAKHTMMSERPEHSEGMMPNQKMRPQNFMPPSRMRPEIEKNHQQFYQQKEFFKPYEKNNYDADKPMNRPKK